MTSVATAAMNSAAIKKEPWTFPVEYTDIIRNTIQQRRQMIPYIYTMARKAHDEGLSLCRPLYYDWPDCPEAYSFRNEYMFGDDMLVAPITAPMEGNFSTLDIWLPQGSWYEVCTGTMLQGGQVVTRNFMIDEYPLYVKAGAIIPQYTDCHQHVGGTDWTQFDLMIYPGADGDFTLYYDDGDDKNYDENNMWVRFQTTRQENTCLVSINPAEGNYIPASRNITLKFVASDVPEHVYYNDKEIGWEYDGENFNLVVALPEGNWKDKTDIRVEYQKNSTINLTDGTLGNYHRAVKAIAELKNHKANLDLNDALGLFGSLGQQLTYFPNTLSESVNLFRQYFDDIDTSLEQQKGMEEDLKTWFKEQVRK